MRELLPFIRSPNFDLLTSIVLLAFDNDKPVWYTATTSSIVKHSDSALHTGFVYFREEINSKGIWLHMPSSLCGKTGGGASRNIWREACMFKTREKFRSKSALQVRVSRT